MSVGDRGGTLHSFDVVSQDGGSKTQEMMRLRRARPIDWISHVLTCSEHVDTQQGRLGMCQNIALRFQTILILAILQNFSSMDTL